MSSTEIPTRNVPSGSACDGRLAPVSDRLADRRFEAVSEGAAVGFRRPRLGLGLLLFLLVGALRPAIAQGLPGAAAKLAEWAAEAAVGEGVGAMKDWLFSGDPNAPPHPIFGWETEGSVGISLPPNCHAKIVLFVPKGQELPKPPAWLAGYVQGATAIAVNNYFGLSSAPRNEDDAADCLLYAARYGGVSAQRMLGYMYLYGEGHLIKDPVKYYELEAKAAAERDVIAIYNLGLAFCYGYGLPRSYSADIESQIRLCLAQLKLAALQNFEPATKALQRFRKAGIAD